MITTIALFFLPLAWASDPAGVIDRIEGEGRAEAVRVRRGEKDFKGVTGSRLSAGDQILTVAGQTVSARLADGSEILIGPSSAVRIDEAGREEPSKSSATLSMAYGMLRCLVRKTFSANEQFRVNTASVAMGVRGTDFLVEHERSAGTTTVHALDGTVALARNPGELGDPAKAVLVRRGTMSAAKAGEAIAPPRPFNYKNLYDHVARVSPAIRDAIRRNQRAIRSAQRSSRHRSHARGPRRYSRPRHR